MTDHPQHIGDSIRTGDAPAGLQIPWRLLVLAMPIIASMVSRTAMSFVDFVMVSQLGTDAQAAIVPAGIILFCVISFGVGMLSMVNTFVAQSFGRGDHQACGQYMWQGLWLAAGLWLILLPGWLIAPAFFKWIGHSPAVQEMEVAYVSIGLFGIGPTLMAMAVVNFFHGIHKPLAGLYVALAGNAFNVVANYALIFGHFGLPAMGIAGAALGTAMAACVELLILMIWIQLPTYATIYGSASQWRINLEKMWRIVRYGMAAGVHFTMDVAAWTIFTVVLVGRFGTVQLAAHNLTFKLLEISFMPVFGLSVAVTASIGKAIGQNNAQLARLTMRWAIVFGVGWMGVMGLLYVVVGRDVAGLLSDDPQVVEWAAKMLLLCAVFQVFDGLHLISIGALKGAADVVWPAVAAATCTLTLFLGGGYYMIRQYPDWGALGPWLAATVYIITLAMLLWPRWLFGPWEKHMADHPPPPEAAMAE